MKGENLAKSHRIALVLSSPLPTGNLTEIPPNYTTDDVLSMDRFGWRTVIGHGLVVGIFSPVAGDLIAHLSGIGHSRRALLVGSHRHRFRPGKSQFRAP